MRNHWIRAAVLLRGSVAAICIVYGAFAPAQAETSARAVRPGIYGNVRLSEATGDLSGIEVEIHAGAGRIVDITVCEGWCNWVYQVAYEDQGGWIAFEILERPYDPPRKFRLTQRGKGALIEEDQEFAVPRYRLKRLKERFGLDVADFSMTEYAKETNAR